MQRKHVEPRRQGKRMFLGMPRDSESCKLHEGRLKGYQSCEGNYGNYSEDKSNGERLTDGEDWGSLQERTLMD